MSDLERKLHRLNEQRAAWLDRIQAMPPDQLVAKPRPGKWSILEHSFRYLLVAVLLRSAIPIRMPSQALAPKGGRSLSELRRLWDENQEWLLAYVRQLDAEGLRRAVFEHPAAGPLTVEQLIHLGQLHIDRHVRQVESLQRLLAHSVGSNP